MFATPDQKELKKHLYELQQQLTYRMKQYLHIHQQKLDRLKNSYFLNTPEALYSQEILRLTHLKDQLFYHFKVQMCIRDSHSDRIPYGVCFWISKKCQW